jgi:hypothetical protein
MLTPSKLTIAFAMLLATCGAAAAQDTDVIPEDRTPPVELVDPQADFRGGEPEAPLGSSFTYQGQIKSSGVPMNGTVNLTFALWDAAGTGCPPTGGAQLGSTITLNGVTITDGLFTVALNATGQFGASAFNGEARWLAITVNGTALCPRQPVTAAPYAFKVPGIDGHSLDAVDGAPVDAVFVNADGKVGINTLTPATRLHVSDALGSAGVAADPVGRLHNNNDSNVSLSLTTGFRTFRVGQNRPPDSLGTVDSFFIYDETAGATRLAVGTTGNVGIGTTNPGARLDVSATTGLGIRATNAASGLNGATLRADNTHAAGIGIYSTTNSTDANAVITNTGTGDIIRGFTSGGDITFRVENNGKTTVDSGLVIDDDALNAGNLTNALQLGGGGSGEAIASKRTAGGNQFGIDFYTASANRMSIANGGNVGIGTTAPGQKLHVNNSSTAGAAIRLEEPSSVNRWDLVATGSASPEGQFKFAIRDNFLGVSRLVIDDAGVVSVPVLQINGADLAEKFPVTDKVEPGMVVEIDPDAAGKLRMARGAYNRRVAGVVSGAGNLPAGAILGNLPGHEDAPPVALSGRVWVNCDATGGAVEPGDLLTTADLPGHAMKAVDYPRAQGAIIGKAMSRLPAGERGLVLVLVNLQ